MSGEVFVDTNVLVYQFDYAEPEKQAKARVWIEQLWAHQAARISLQVLQEFYNTITRKLSRPVAVREARTAVRDLAEWDPVIPGMSTLEQAFGIESRYQLAWWDAMIVAAAKEGGCRYLLSEDLQHGQDFEGLTVVDFKRLTPEELLPSAS